MPLDAHHRGAIPRRLAVQIKGLVPHAHHGGPGTQHESTADPVDDQQVVFHARVDQRLATVCEDVEDGRYLAIAGEPEVGEAAVIEDQCRHDVLRVLAFGD